MKKLICILLALMPVFISCVKRDWTNPFSSDCPKEIWTPTNFAAIQEGTTVKLTWSQPINNISGFKIQKSIDGVAGSTMQDPTKGTTQLTDNILTGGKVHLYSLTAFAGSNTSNTVTAQITPVSTAGITTTAVSAVGAATAQSGGTISSDGGAAITARGVCWATTQNPTIAGTKTSDGTGTGSFASSMTGLSPGTTYYLRAYAINSVGTAYGNEISFTTSATIPAITTTALSAIASTTAVSGGSITTAGGATITARGVCWGTVSGPTILNSKTTDGTGTGSFSSSISGLIPGTTYYIRAYATNSAGTAYGNEITFSSTATLPILTTTAISAIAATTASSGGNVTTDGGAAIIARGVCWSTAQTPTIAGTKTTDGTGTGSFTSSISGLTPGATYYVRAYAINSVGTAYGNEVSFTSAATLSTLTTTAISSVTSTTASGGGNITADGGAAITARGVCWGTAPTPTIAGTKTTDGTGTGSFTSPISGLIPGATYYVRAYATNSAGTVYGNEVTFSALALLPTLTTTAISSIAATSATSGGNITADGGAAVSARGVCWGTISNPTITSSKTTDGTGTGSFTSTITGLVAGTTYYVRAYAINSSGTGYGTQVSFTTAATSGTTVTDVDGNVYKTVTIGTQVWIASNLKATKYKDGTAIPLVTDATAWDTWDDPATPAYCWYNNDPTYKDPYGALYNWYTVNTGKLCPTGWHMPSDAEWTVLTDYLGGKTGDKLKETGTAHWTSLNSDATNETGFTALPGGSIGLNGAFYGIGNNGYWWSSTEGGTTDAWKREMGYGYSHDGYYYNYVLRGSFYKTAGFSVRCILGELTLPTLSTTSISGITSTSAVSGGNISSDGGTAITARGVCWSTTYTPTIANPKTTDGSGIGSFTSAITGLTGGTTYNVRAYATYSAGTVYGNQFSFTALAPNLPSLTTTAVSAITATSATSGGNVSSDGGATVTARGVCWSMTSNPTTSNSLTTNGTGTGDFSSSISGLTPNTTYYARAYARNSFGTAYGNEVSFKTVSNIPTVSTSNITSITNTSATCGGSISSDGGATVSSRGVCWSTTSNPTISNSKTTDGTGTGSFVSTLTGLATNTTYYVRAYAINSQGTGYGTQVSFTTSASSITTVTDLDGNVYKTVTTGEEEWMAENLKTTKYNDGTAIPMVTDATTWANLLTPGYSWYNNDAATNKNTYGALYNWYTVNTGKLCPTGWHVPNDAEWTSLTTSLGGESVAGGKLKEAGTIHWFGPNTGATNSTGFSALPGGSRPEDGTFGGIGSAGSWWSSKENTPLSAWARNMTHLVSEVGNYAPGKQSGHSVRCVKKEFTLPTLSTTSNSNITSTSATSGGNVSSDGGATVTARGVCWSTTSGPTTSNSKTIDGTGTGVFTSSLTGLAAGATYYVRAYASNLAGTVYGNEVTFKAAANLPTLTTTGITAITATSAICGGTISSDGGATVSSRGVCWATTSNPTTSNNKTNDGTGTGSFVSAISGLSAGTTYYVRAYATNSAGTGYGTQVSFTTSGASGATITDVEGNVYKTVTIGTQVWMAENLKTTLYNDNTAIPLVTDATTWANLATPGYCWYNNNASANKSLYGALYNWYTVNTGKLCPTGWHVPSDTEWTMLTTYLGGDSIAGGKLKETGTSHWLSPNYGASNTTGFTAVPGGFRSNNGGAFNDLGSDVYWWTSSDYLANSVWHRYIVYHSSNVYRDNISKQFGFAVRCLRDY